MGVYSEKLFELVPVIRRNYEKKSLDTMCQVITVEGWLEQYYEIEYLKVVPEYLESNDGIITGKRFFLITEEENVGLKAAFAILNYPLYTGMREMGMLEEGGDMLSSFAKGERSCNSSLTRLSTIKEYSYLLTGATSDTEIMYFTGLEEEAGDLNLENKLRCIMSCNASLQFVQLQEEQLDMPWVRELLMNRECEIINFPRCSQAHYVKLMNELLEGERYRLDDSLHLAQILNSIRKKCGNKFGEEYIAWIFDLAEKRARSRRDYRYFKAEDLKLDSYSLTSPLKKLKDMTGLTEMKQLAYEYAALSKEQLRNEKLADICKHVIFEGKPGTGKTMCGKIMAQVMSEQGQSNGVFVIAARKDIVGEYVGQTAPKVSGLFNKARRGILFVDEAGFLLHEGRNSFNQEAVKEFVRYMELYRDVMVIFALYPGEVDDFLKLDVGLSSRISRVITFKDYSEQELLDITRGMCEEKGYQLSEDSEEIIRTYMRGQRKSLGEEFGNAREGRKLVEAAVIARSVRCFDEIVLEETPVLIAEDFIYGINRLYQERGKKTSSIGFVAGGM